MNFGNIALIKGKSAIPPLLNGPKVLPSASDKETLFAMTQVSLYLLFLLELI